MDFMPVIQRLTEGWGGKGRLVCCSYYSLRRSCADLRSICLTRLSGSRDKMAVTLAQVSR
nr:MAG TPA: hypothetical protein [Caudoviricetes sp.]